MTGSIQDALVDRIQQRSGEGRPRRQPQPAGRERYGRDHPLYDVLAEKQDQRTTLGNGTAFSAVAPS
jgi:hypothetical protein